MRTPRSSALFDTDPRQLATLFDVAPDADRLWRDEELGAILKHQMSAPLVTVHGVSLLAFPPAACGTA